MMIRLMRITMKYLNPHSKYNTSKTNLHNAWLFIHLLYWYINRLTSCSIVDHMLIVAVVSWCPGPRHLHYRWHNLHPLPLTHTTAGLDCIISSSTNPPSVRPSVSCWWVYPHRLFGSATLLMMYRSIRLSPVAWPLVYDCVVCCGILEVEFELGNFTWYIHGTTNKIGRIFEKV